jgi:hypothetical protein
MGGGRGGGRERIDGKRDGGREKEGGSDREEGGREKGRIKNLIFCVQKCQLML